MENFPLREGYFPIAYKPNAFLYGNKVFDTEHYDEYMSEQWRQSTKARKQTLDAAEEYNDARGLYLDSCLNKSGWRLVQVQN